MNKRLYRSERDKVIFGVCGGIAEYFNIDSTFVRLIIALLIFAGGASIWVYFIAAIIIPKEPWVHL